MPDPREPDELLETARRAALEAAELVRQRSADEVRVAATKSSPVDIVTEADRAAEELIRSLLLEAGPGDGFVGEEGGCADSATGVTWVVDPIDGTVNFFYGIPHYSVSVAARRDGRVVAGAVVNVATGECFTATDGGGAFRGGRPLRVREPVPLAQRLVGTGFNYRLEVRTAQARAAARMLPEIRDVRRLGSAALDLCAVAAGHLDGYVEEGLHEWDMAAGGLVATEAGARLETRVGVGGMTCVICAGAAGFDDFADLVERSGFLREQTSGAGR